MCSTWGRCRRSPRQSTAGPPREPTGLLCSLEMVHSTAQPSPSPHRAGSRSTAQHFATQQEAKLRVVHLPIRPSHFTHRSTARPWSSLGPPGSTQLRMAAAIEGSVALTAPSQPQWSTGTARCLDFTPVSSTYSVDKNSSLISKAIKPTLQMITLGPQELLKRLTSCIPAKNTEDRAPAFWGINGQPCRTGGIFPSAWVSGKTGWLLSLLAELNTHNKHWPYITENESAKKAS